MMIEVTKKYNRLSFSKDASYEFKAQKLKIAPSMTATIAIMQVSTLHNARYAQSRQFVAIAGINEVMIIAMKPEPQRVFSLPRHNTCRDHKVPYISWGFGLTPQISPDRTITILAVAWDTIIQMIYIDEETN